jgi:hypothetical protein
MAEQRRRHFLPTAVGALSHAEVGANAANLAFAVHAEDQSLWPALSQGSGKPAMWKVFADTVDDSPLHWIHPFHGHGLNN